MSEKRTSYAFLMEMLWVCGFFALSACIFVLSFGKAESLSRQAEELNHAVSETQNCLETVFATYTEGTNGPDGIAVTVHFYDKSWAPTASSPADAFYTITVTGEETDGLLHLTAEAAKQNGESIYTLQGFRSCQNTSSKASDETIKNKQTEGRTP